MTTPTQYLRATNQDGNCSERLMSDLGTAGGHAAALAKEDSGFDPGLTDEIPASDAGGHLLIYYKNNIYRNN